MHAAEAKLRRESVKSQNLQSRTESMTAMKDMLSDIIQQVVESEKSERASRLEAADHRQI